jgi:hypothetical protein
MSAEMSRQPRYAEPIEGVASRYWAIELDGKPNDDSNQRLGRHFQQQFDTALNKNGSPAGAP